MKNNSAKFCSCIKSVRKSVKPRNNGTKEGAAIAICVSKMLHTKGRTLKKFSCKKPAGPYLKTQTRKAARR
uniref:Uncharacterized protein n=1 Tax=viral metagenome TaxID=1070528 RepID=A0A6C0DCY3_9ZZZZ